MIVLCYLLNPVVCRICSDVPLFIPSDVGNLYSVYFSWSVLVIYFKIYFSRLILHLIPTSDRWADHLIKKEYFSCNQKIGFYCLEVKIAWLKTESAEGQSI